MKKENVIGENVEAGTNAESDEKAGTKINKESDAKKSKKFRKEFLSQKQKDTTFLVIKIILVCMFAGAYSMLYIWDLYTFKGKSLSYENCSSNIVVCKFFSINVCKNKS